MQGIVQAVKVGQAGGYSMKVNEVWYTNKFINTSPPDAGDSVEFQIKEGTTFFINPVRITKAPQPEPQAAAQAAPARAPYQPSRGLFPIPEGDGQESIVRQSALKMAYGIVPQGSLDHLLVVSELLTLWALGRYTREQVVSEYDQYTGAIQSPMEKKDDIPF